MEIITFLIAVTGFLMSLATWLRELLLRRNQMALEIIDYKQYNHCLQFFLLLQNQSSLPASIAEISVSPDKTNWFTCELEPTKIKETFSGYIGQTPQFPLNLQPVSFCVEYFSFPNCEGIELNPDTAVSFRIRTSRGNLIRSATLGKPGHYLNIEFEI